MIVILYACYGFRSRATKEAYGDSAVGYVQIKREGRKCVIKVKVTPEHKVHETGYSIIIEIDETEENILSCKCQSCAASEGSNNI